MTSCLARRLGLGLDQPGGARLVLVAGSASLLDSAAIISVGTTLPLWRSELGLSDWAVGAISSSFTLFIALGALLGGPCADRVGRARVFSMTVGLYAVAAAILAAASSQSAVTVGAAILGFAVGADLPASLALVGERAPAALRSRMVALSHVLWTLGIVAATGLAFLVSSAGLAGMRFVFLLLGGAGVAAVVARHRVVPPHGHATALTATVPAASRCTDEPAAHAGRRRLLVLVALFYVLYTLVSSTFGTFRTYLMVVLGGASQAAATGVAFAVTLLGLAGTLAFSARADVAQRRRAYPVGAVLIVCSQALLAVDGGRSFAITVLALVVFSLGYPHVGEGLYKVWSQDLAAAASRATVQGASISLARACAAAFALVTPVLAAERPSMLFLATTLLAALAVAVGWRVVRSERAPDVPRRPAG